MKGGSKVSASGIHNDEAGIFVTCDKGQESKCLREMDDILSEVPFFAHPVLVIGVVTEVFAVPQLASRRCWPY